jgi:hypothetical protein
MHSHNISLIANFHMPSHRSSNERGKAKAEQSKLFQTVEDNPTLLDLLETATSPARQTIFIESLLKADPTTALTDLQDTKSPVHLFQLFTTWFGSYSGSAAQFQGIQAAVQHRKKYFMEKRHHKKEFMFDIGLDWSPDIRDDFISRVNSICDLVMQTSFPL